MIALVEMRANLSFVKSLRIFCDTQITLSSVSL